MTPLRSGTPFVLLDDARRDRQGSARLYRAPRAQIAARNLDEVVPALERMRAAVKDGAHLAGHIGYEAGLALEPRLRGLARSDEAHPLLWFGLFDGWEDVTPEALADLLGDPEGATAGPLTPRISEADYSAAIGKILGYIGAGDIYQANFTFRTDAPIAGSPLSLYAGLREAGGGGWGGIVHDGTNWLLSCSPELFFTLKGGVLTARPMKGTLPPGLDPELLRGDAKQRAENLMIVDLLRNDLSRVAKSGSVAVPALFEVEKYPTVLQMTSTVTAELAPGRDAIDVIEAIFPCGSITGAPKIRAMEIIAQVEQDARGPYTGSIGRIDASGDAAFNVAIRTLVIGADRSRASIGLGSGIVADSLSFEEWRECLAKGAFLTAQGTPYDLIETMRFDAEDGLVELERHLARLKSSAAALGFPCDRHALRNDLQAATFRLRQDSRVRMRLSRTGAVVIETSPLPASPPVAQVALARRPVAQDDFRLRHKTSNRAFYDDTRAASGAFEVALVDDEGFVTEGSFTNIFVERDGVLLTPPIERGLLPGVLRAKLLDEGKAVEADIRPEDLEGGFLIGNALRGLIPARLVAVAKEAGL